MFGLSSSSSCFYPDSTSYLLYFVPRSPAALPEVTSGDRTPVPNRLYCLRWAGEQTAPPTVEVREW